MPRRPPPNRMNLSDDDSEATAPLRNMVARANGGFARAHGNGHRNGRRPAYDMDDDSTVVSSLIAPPARKAYDDDDDDEYT